MLGSGLWEASTAEFVGNFGVLSSRRWWIWLLDASATPCSTCICRALVQASGSRSAGGLQDDRMPDSAGRAALPMVWTGYDLIVIFISRKLRLPLVRTSAAADTCRLVLCKLTVFDKHMSYERVGIHSSSKAMLRKGKLVRHMNLQPKPAASCAGWMRGHRLASGRVLVACKLSFRFLSCCP